MRLKTLRTSSAREANDPHFPDFQICQPVIPTTMGSTMAAEANGVTSFGTCKNRTAAWHHNAPMISAIIAGLMAFFHSKSEQSRLVHSTAEDAEDRRGR